MTTKHSKHSNTTDWDKDNDPPVEKPDPKPDPLAKIADDPHQQKMVKVKCISDRRPYIQDGKQLEMGEEAEVTEEVAALLRERGMVE